MRISSIEAFWRSLLALLAATWVVSAAAAAPAAGGLAYSRAQIDRAVAMADVPVGTGLTAGRRGLVLPLEPGGREEELRDWDGLKQDTLYFGVTQMAVIGALYISPKSISGWSSEDKDEYSFEKWKSNIRHVVWDTDKWWINYTLHPYWGGAYYVRAAERGYGPAPSFWYSVMLSTMYEFGAEALFEKPSIQDLVFTPGLGFFVGRYFMSVRDGIQARALGGEALSGTDKAKLFFTDPLGAVNRRINSALGREASFTLVPVVMLDDRAAPATDTASAAPAGLFSGVRLHLAW